MKEEEEENDFEVKKEKSEERRERLGKALQNKTKKETGVSQDE